MKGGQSNTFRTSTNITRSTENMVKILVTNLERTIPYDQSYTSISLEKWLLKRSITLVGTIQANRKGIFVELQTFNVGMWSHNKFLGKYDKNKLTKILFRGHTRETLIVGIAYGCPY